MDARAIDLLQRAESSVATSRSVGDSPISGTSPFVTNLPVCRSRETDPGETTAWIISVRALHCCESKSAAKDQCNAKRLASPLRPIVILFVFPDTESPAAEAFHLLGVRLRHMRRQRQLKKILITSTIPQEGKSMVASNLACTIALRTQQKVLLLEGDVRRPTQSKIFGLPKKPGICEWLNGDRTLIKSMYRLEGPEIWILPAGMATGNSLELLQSGRAALMMEQLTNWFDWLIIDSPPVLPLADTSVWTNLADGILLVARQGTTQKRQLQRGLEALGTQKLIGAILNSARSVANTDYYYRPTNRLPTDDAEA